jgi:hypothetical protein
MSELRDLIQDKIGEMNGHIEAARVIRAELTAAGVSSRRMSKKAAPANGEPKVRRVRRTKEQMAPVLAIETMPMPDSVIGPS